MKLVIVSTFWNSEDYVADCIKSIKNQYYGNFVVYMVDDMSTDNSYNVALDAIDGDERFILIKNTEKKYKTKNFIDVINNNPDIDWDDVIIEIDGDDQLSDNFVLGLINKIYMNENIWICGSKWMDKDGVVGNYGKFSANKARIKSWNFSHMRTYRAFLFRTIKEEHLMYEGEYFKAGCDIGAGIPMLEMAGDAHFYYLDQVTYIYTWHDNQSYSSTNSFGDKTLQSKIAGYVYKLPRYENVVIVDENGISFKPHYGKPKESQLLLNELTKPKPRLSKRPIVVEPQVLSTPVVKVDKNKNFELINRFMTKSEPTDNVNYNVINKIIQNKGVYVPPKKDVKPTRELVPNYRNQLTELKKDSMVNQRKQLQDSFTTKRKKGGLYF
jgi:glycosyltransferase involved in cell wall biosynthesis